MPVIKADDARLAADLVVLDLGDISRQGAEAKERGYAAGYADGMRQASAELDRLQSDWIAALRTWEVDHERLMVEAGQSVVELAVLLAQKVVHRTPQIDPSVVVDQVGQVLRHVGRSCDAAVRVHPSDRPMVEQCLPRLCEAIGGCEHVTLVEDPSIEPGGCVVTTQAGRIDATLARQMQRLAEALLPEPRQALEAA